MGNITFSYSDAKLLKENPHGSEIMVASKSMVFKDDKTCEINGQKATPQEARLFIIEMAKYHKAYCETPTATRKFLLEEQIRSLLNADDKPMNINYMPTSDYVCMSVRSNGTLTIMGNDFESSEDNMLIARLLFSISLEKDGGPIPQ